MTTETNTIHRCDGCGHHLSLFGDNKFPQDGWLHSVRILTQSGNERDSRINFGDLCPECVVILTEITSALKDNFMDRVERSTDLVDAENS